MSFTINLCGKFRVSGKIMWKGQRGLCENHPWKNKVYPKCENTKRGKGRYKNTQ